MKTTTLPTLATAVAMVFAGGAFAQTNGTFLFTSSNTVSPATPSTTVGIWATWDDPLNQYVFGGADYDITAGDGLFSDPTNVLNGPGSTAGIANGNMITGGINGAIYIPGFPWPSPNPILLASYTWTAADFTPRTVDLFTSNTANFIVALKTTGRTIPLYPAQFAPGSGGITVVPAPGAWLVLGVSMLAGRRRRWA